MRRYLVSFHYIVNGTMRFGSHVVEREQPLGVTLTSVGDEQEILRLEYSCSSIMILNWDELLAPELMPQLPGGYTYFLSYWALMGDYSLLGRTGWAFTDPIWTLRGLRAVEQDICRIKGCDRVALTACKPIWEAVEDS